jgi:hypothetical protein
MRKYCPISGDACRESDCVFWICLSALGKDLKDVEVCGLKALMVAYLLNTGIKISNLIGGVKSE